jgi:hypothetical protein
VARVVWAVTVLMVVPVWLAVRARPRLLRVRPVGPAVMAAPAGPPALAVRAAMVVWPWVWAPRVPMAAVAMVAPGVPPAVVVTALRVRAALPGPLRVARAARAVMPVRPVVRARPD